MFEFFRILYTNLALRSTTPSHTVAKELFAASSKEISDIQRQLTELETCLTHEWNVVVEAVNGNNMDQAKVAALKHQSYLKRYCSLNIAVVNVYEKEIGKLKETGSEYPISVLQQQQMAKEVKEMEHFCSLGLNADGDIDYAIHERIFSQLLENVEEKCPLIYSILQTLLVSDTRKRVHKTPDFKMKCGVNALALLLSVHNQSFTNDVRLLFGFLCITYGAGKQFVNMLHKIGLTPHWDTLYVYCI